MSAIALIPHVSHRAVASCKLCPFEHTGYDTRTCQVSDLEDDALSDIELPRTCPLRAGSITVSMFVPPIIGEKP